ncbi:MAG: GNAT family N-acetyltransferase [Phycisphaerae bacterium]
MTAGWKGEKVRLVPLDKARHFENVLHWANTPELTHWLLMGDLPLGRAAEEEWFDRMSRGTDTDVVFAIETLSGEHIGSSGLHRVDVRQGVAYTGTIIGRPEFWGQGYGGDAMRLRTWWAFEVYGLRMLLSEVHAENDASIRGLKRAGYKECGVMPRRTWKRGEYRDVVILVCDRDEWRKLPAGPYAGLNRPAAK